MEIGKRFSPYMMFIGSFIPNALMEYTGISSSAKLLWARLAQHAGKSGICYPAQSTLAKELGISSRWVQKCLGQLVEKKFIRIIYPKGDKKLFHKTCRYHFLWHEIFENAKLRSDPKVDEMDNEGWMPMHTIERLKKAGWKKAGWKPITEEEWKNKKESSRNYGSENQSYNPRSDRRTPRYEVHKL